MDPVTLLLRWAHVLAAIAALGGLLFARFALVPAAEELGAETADRLHAGVRRRWLPWVIGAITLLLASGLANYVLLMRRVKAAPELWLHSTPVIVHDPFSPPRASSNAGTITAIRK
jgi:uncharacterized membrane protein